jgi:hypothetical protein
VIHVPTFVSILCFAASSAFAQRSVWNLDPTGANGAHFTSLQAAADSPLVAPGDILVLAPGSYGTLDTSKPLVVLGVPNAVVVHMAIHDIATGSEFVIRGVSFYDPATASFAYVEAVHCAGRIVVADAALVPTGSFPQYELRKILATAGCADVELADVQTVGAAAYFADSRTTVRHCILWPASTNPGIEASSALTAHQSTVEIVDTQVRARPYTSNAPGARIIDGVVRWRGASSAAGSTAPGSSALWVLRARIEVDPQVVLGTVVNDSGTIVQRPLPALATTMSPGSAQATLTTQPGAPAIVAFGLARAPVDIGLGAMLRLDPSAGICSLAAGVGTVSSTIAVPANRAFVGVAFAAQGLAFAENETRLANGAALVIR